MTPVINQAPGDEHKEPFQVNFTWARICKCKKCGQIEKCTLVDGEWICEGCA